MRIKAVIAYDGTGYSGFQIQKNAPTVQAEVEQVLAQLTGEPIRILGAGRTDAGVHAEGQVVAFDTSWRHPPSDLQRGMNALLSDQIAVFELSRVEPDFHPRFDAVRRWYRYTIYQSAVSHPMFTRYSLRVGRSLEIDAMSEATRSLIGRHDFLAFGSPPQGDNSVRNVVRAIWTSEEPWLYFDIEADAFLYRMVRMLVGTLLRVGYGAITPEAFEEILTSRARERAGPAVVAKGLCLKSVFYTNDGCGHSLKEMGRHQTRSKT
ncbi:MAG: tRNA pseudouridine(38-40) synthase TruA [Anaerolineae bacterium]